MLHKESVDKQLLELLEKIMHNSLFNSFVLVGGTALALQIGHRISIDIDLFSTKALVENDITAFLLNCGEATLLQKSPSILIYKVNDLKADFVSYNYVWLNKSIVKENIYRLASLEDIAAMKLNAIAGRGSKKDFIDVYFLLNYFSLNEMLDFYTKKYKAASVFMVLKSLTYFEDAEIEPMPKMLKTVSWQDIKQTIINHVKTIALT